MKLKTKYLYALIMTICPLSIHANTNLSAEELSRKAQDPLADVKAIMTDNTIGFGGGAEKPIYGFQVQPVYSMPAANGDNYIARGIIPIVGVPGSSEVPKLGPDLTPASNGTKWGLSDILLQLFWSPKSDSDIKWGIGPQVSLRTRTSDPVAGPGWGGGLSGVLFGFSGDISYGAILGHHWGQERYSLTTIQPIIFYNIASMPGYYLGYNNSVTYNWNANSGQRWQVPLGLIVGRTFPLGSDGYALDVNGGAYSLIARPDNGSSWQAKFSVSLFFP